MRRYVMSRGGASPSNPLLLDARDGWARGPASRQRLKCTHREQRRAIDPSAPGAAAGARAVLRPTPNREPRRRRPKQTRGRLLHRIPLVTRSSTVQPIAGPIAILSSHACALWRPPSSRERRRARSCPDSPPEKGGLLPSSLPSLRPASSKQTPRVTQTPLARRGRDLAEEAAGRAAPPSAPPAWALAGSLKSCWPVHNGELFFSSLPRKKRARANRPPPARSARRSIGGALPGAPGQPRTSARAVLAGRARVAEREGHQRRRRRRPPQTPPPTPSPLLGSASARFVARRRTTSAASKTSPAPAALYTLG